MKQLKRTIETMFLAVSIFLLTADNAWCCLGGVISFVLFLFLVYVWEKNTWAEDVSDEIFYR